MANGSQTKTDPLARMKGGESTVSTPSKGFDPLAGNKDRMAQLREMKKARDERLANEEGLEQIKLEEGLRATEGPEAAAAASRAFLANRGPVTSKSIRSQLDTASNEIDQFENMIKTDSGSVSIDDLTQQQLDLIKNRREELASRESDLVQSIRAQVGQQVEQTEDVQRQAKGAARSQLARIGALGTTSAGTQYIQDLEQDHIRELNGIRQQGEQLILQARTAIADADFELLGKNLEILQQSKRDQIAAEESRVNNILKLQQIQQFERETSAATISALVSGGISQAELPAGFFESLDRSAGYQAGTSSLIFQAEQAEAAQQSFADQLAVAEKAISIANSLPSGEVIRIGNTEIVGTGSDYRWNIEIDDEGNGTAVVFDADAGISSLAAVPLGRIGSSKQNWEYLYDESGGLVAVNNQSNEVKRVTLPGENINPQNYQGFESWTSRLGVRTVEFGGSTKFEQFHPGVDIAAADGTPITPFFPPGINEMTVVDVENTKTARDEGFGNFVVLADANGAMYRYSHLSETDGVNVKVGDVVNASQVIGRVGNTGSTYSTVGGDGSHLDLRVFTDETALSKKQPIPEGPIGLEDLSTTERLQSSALSVDIFGKRAGTKPENVSLIANLVREGKTVDQIKDELRFAGQSPVFIGVVRDAAENIAIDFTDSKRDAFFDNIDRNLEAGNVEQALESIKIGAIRSFGVDEQKQIRGKDRTVEFLLEIKEDLSEFERLGGKTGIFNGTTEKIAGKVGAVKDPELRRIATKVQTAIQQYRRAMSGVAFSVPESAEYEALFPNINKKFSYNEAVLDGLLGTFIGDLDFQLGSVMGHGAYSSLYGGAGASLGGQQIGREQAGSSVESLKATFSDMEDIIDILLLEGNSPEEINAALSQK